MNGSKKQIIFITYILLINIICSNFQNMLNVVYIKRDKYVYRSVIYLFCVNAENWRINLLYTVCFM